MIIKSIKVSGFKNVTDAEPKQHEFFYNTLIKGENYSGKTSLGDALCWVFSGYSSTGITAEYLLKNDKSSDMSVEVVFEDITGTVHTLNRQLSEHKQHIYLDNVPINESKLSAYIGDPEMFLAIFMIGYFHKLSSKAAKELLMGVIPFPSHDKIVNKLSKDLREYLPSAQQFDSNALLKQKRSELKLVEDDIKRCQAKLNMAAEKLKSADVQQLTDETELKDKIGSLEIRKENLIKALAQNNTVGYLEGKLSVLRLEILNLSNKKTVSLTHLDKLCPTCKRPIPEEELLKLEQRIEEQNVIIHQRLQKLKEDEDVLLQDIRESRDKSNESKALQDELTSVNNELNTLKSQYEKIILHNQAVRSELNFIAENQKAFEASTAALEKLSEERYKINRTITAVSEYNSIKADMQYEIMRSNLNNVSIRLQRLNQSTHELRDVFEVLYKGREYSQVSTSEAIRAGMEISDFLNTRTGLQLPIFIDNAESITHYIKPQTQIFEAKVEKDAPLTVIELA